MAELLQNNFKILRERSGQNQAQLSLSLGFSRGAWNNYEKGISKPNLEDFIKITKHFGCTASELLEMDLQNVHLNEKSELSKKQQNVHPIVHPNVHPIGKIEQQNRDFHLHVVAEPDAKYGEKMLPIPITDISVAAGAGVYNSHYIETVDSIHLPTSLVRLGHTYLCVKIKGVSMAPTLQDGGYVVVRQLDRGDWAKMPDECVYVVVDSEGKSYLKRVKNRFKKGFIVLRSDSPDRASYPSFNLEVKEIMSIWYAEWYFSAKMPNIHDQFYSRLQQMEDDMDVMKQRLLKINP
jgi:phage repressor protein C with HTH and peptisase S24 domain